MVFLNQYSKNDFMTCHLVLDDIVLNVFSLVNILFLQNFVQGQHFSITSNLNKVVYSWLSSPTLAFQFSFDHLYNRVVMYKIGFELFSI